MINANEAAKIDRVPVLVFSSRDPALLTGKELAGKAIVAPQPAFAKIPRDQVMATYAKMQAFDAAVQEANAAVDCSRSTASIRAQCSLATRLRLAATACATAANSERRTAALDRSRRNECWPTGCFARHSGSGRSQGRGEERDRYFARFRSSIERYICAFDGSLRPYRHDRDRRAHG